MKLKIGIVDYNIGNWGSLKNSLSKLGFRASISKDYDKLSESDLIILPGVGAYKPAIEAIIARGLDKTINAMANKNKPIIGICLGMQLLGRSSLENTYTKGLNLIPEDVIPIGLDSCHIGWNEVRLVKKLDPLLNKSDGMNFYFNHSFGFKSNLDFTICESTFKSKNFTSIIRKENIIGLQFHPEKSQKSGLKFLKELILKLCLND